MNGIPETFRRKIEDVGGDEIVDTVFVLHSEFFLDASLSMDEVRNGSESVRAYQTEITHNWKLKFVSNGTRLDVELQFVSYSGLATNSRYPVNVKFTPHVVNGEAESLMISPTIELDEMFPGDDLIKGTIDTTNLENGLIGPDGRLSVRCHMHTTQLCRKDYTVDALLGRTGPTTQ